MKILIDINHPAHVHYFRNFISEIQKRGHICIITNRDSPFIMAFLEDYGIRHIIRSSRPKKDLNHRANKKKQSYK
jgi:predicted glycosyltransferase